MRRALALIAALVTTAGLGSVFAVSDGTYSPERMHCSGAADNVESPARAEPGCHNTTVTVTDLAGHEYFGIGSPQTPNNEQGPVPGILPFGLVSNMHKGDVWYDLGDGCTRIVVDAATPTEPESGGCPWLDSGAPNYYGPNPAPNPASGIRIYFGLDDNTAGGEHDSSELINNGPSDGGGLHVVLDPASLGPWLTAFVENNPEFILTHPLPVADAGIGFCADGVCLSAQTQRHVAYQGGKSDGSHRDVSDYSDKRWDPSSCSGESDGSTNPNQCKDGSTPHDIRYWHDQEGTTYVEPGVQIYEDPDPQGSPIGPYPIPALYVGTCGVIVGGGNFKMPASDHTNPQTGQFILRTGCN